MSEHPIIFNGEMIRTILISLKTQTRRLIKPTKKTKWLLCDDWADSFIKDPGNYLIEACPYGQIGDHLWARETWAENPDGDGLIYRATDPGWDDSGSGLLWNSPIFMPHWASRIKLEIINIRVERVQEIKPLDAVAEGCSSDRYSVIEFRNLWNSINAKRGYGWDINPWVWVIEFKYWRFNEPDSQLHRKKSGGMDLRQPT